MPELPLPAPLAQATVLDREGDIYQRLLKNRIIFLGTQVEDQSANLICAQLLLLQADDPESDIALYINSPGGSVTAGLAFYDTIQYVSFAVPTRRLPVGASMGDFLRCSG